MLTLHDAKLRQATIERIVAELNNAMRAGTSVGMFFEVNTSEWRTMDASHGTPRIDVLTFVDPTKIKAE